MLYFRVAGTLNCIWINIFRYADIFIGGLDENILTKQHFVASRPYYHDKLTWCVQKNHQIPGWKNIFHVFRDPIVVISLTILFIAAVSTAYFMEQFEVQKLDWNRTTLNIFAMVFYMPIVYNPNTNPMRIFFVIGQFGCMILSIVLLSFILSCLTNPIYEHQVKTTIEIMRGSFGLVGDAFALEHLIDQQKVISLNLFEIYFEADYIYKYSQKYPGEMLEDSKFVTIWISVCQCSR